MIRINLQTAGQKRQKRKAATADFGGGGGSSSSFLPALMLVLPIAGSAGGSYYVHAALIEQAERTQAEIRVGEAELARLKPILDELQQFKKDKALLEKKLSAIRTLEGARIGPVQIYAELASIMPPQIWVTGIKESGKTAVIDGLGLDSQSIAIFVNSMQHSRYFANVELNVVEQAKYLGLDIKKFNVTCRFVNPDAPKAAVEATASPATPRRGR